MRQELQSNSPHTSHKGWSFYCQYFSGSAARADIATFHVSCCKLAGQAGNVQLWVLSEESTRLSAQLMCPTVRWRIVPRDIGGLCRWSKCLLGIMMYLRSCLWSTVVDIVISLPLLSALWRINMYQWRSLLPSAGRYVNILLAVPSLLSSPITTLSTLITRKLSCSQSPTRPVHQANFSSGI